MSENKKELDSIEDLLDSFENEEILTKKMDSFASKKEEQQKLVKNKPKNIPENEYTILQEFVIPPEAPSLDTEKTRKQPVIKPEIKQPAIKPADTGGTRVYASKEVEQVNKSRTETVVFDNKDVKKISQEGKTVTLQRKSAPVLEKKPERSHLWGIIASVLAGIALVSLLIFGIFRFVIGNNDKPADDSSFKSIEAWAETLKEDNLDSVIQYESIYNKLSEEQKSRINDLLKEICGKDFDELLAQAKSKDKDKADSKNNNTKVAEQKAALKDKISQLQSQIDTLKASLSQINASIDEAYALMQSAQSDYDAAQNEVNTANSQLSAANESLRTAQARQSELQAKDADNSITPAEKEELSSLAGQITEYQNDIKTAQQAVSDAQSALSAAQNALSSATSSYESMSSDGDPIQAQIDSLQQELNEKQSQLNAL